MLTSIAPKLPMRDKNATKDFYLNKLEFSLISDYENYLIIGKDQIEIHFFDFRNLNPNENYGQIYIRVSEIEEVYQSLLKKQVSIHPNGHLHLKPWGQKEFSLLDPDKNLLTFGETLIQN